MGKRKQCIWLPEVLSFSPILDSRLPRSPKFKDVFTPGIETEHLQKELVFFPNVTRGWYHWGIAQAVVLHTHKFLLFVCLIKKMRNANVFQLLWFFLVAFVFIICIRDWCVTTCKRPHAQCDLYHFTAPVCGSLLVLSPLPQCIYVYLFDKKMHVFITKTKFPLLESIKYISFFFHS